MPIRMVDDPQGPDNQGNRRRRSTGGGGGGLLAFLPLILRLFGSKAGIVILLLLAGGYFVMSQKGCGMASLSNVSELATGGFLDPRQFEKAAIYESLAPDDTRNPIPESANLIRFAPVPGNQGSQGSCVGWSSAYAARTILEATRTKQPPDNLRFSPSFLYNQIGLQGCQGSYLIKAMEFMTQQGSIPYEEFPYSEQGCDQQPSSAQIAEAAQFKMRGFNRLSLGNRNDQLDLRAIKENLSQGAPVVIGMMVGPSFMEPMTGKDLWEPYDSDDNMAGFGGHAMCLVGYDDVKYGGSFLIMNSWGQDWGRNGFAWIRYSDFEYFGKEAYGIEPMAPVGSAANEQLAVELGLVKVEFDGQSMVPKGYLQLVSSLKNTFRTVAPIGLQTRFKLEVKNSAECYVYIFGKEADGTSYTLFPYPDEKEPQKTRYSPFCGITGYRLFPKDKSMMPDTIGTMDVIALVVSKEPLDWYALAKQISQNPQTDFGLRVNQALGNRRMETVNFTIKETGTIGFNAKPNEGKLIACIIEMEK